MKEEKYKLNQDVLAEVMDDILPQFAVTKQQAKAVLASYFKKKKLRIDVDDKLFNEVWLVVVGRNIAPKRYETKALVIQYLEELRKEKAKK